MEIERTKQFAVEVIDLLKHSPQCRMPFNKFIPAYHHHFGKQCKVAEYGFTKLIELFEAVPHIVQVTNKINMSLCHVSICAIFTSNFAQAYHKDVCSPFNVLFLRLTSYVCAP